MFRARLSYRVLVRARVNDRVLVGVSCTHTFLGRVPPRHMLAWVKGKCDLAKVLLCPCVLPLEPTYGGRDQVRVRVGVSGRVTVRVSNR